MSALLDAAPEAIARFILSTTDTTRHDRLWPAHSLVFETNPLSVAYGACGTALFLHALYGELPDDVRTWMLDRPVSVDHYAPGLYVGLAGIAMAFDRFGLSERAVEIMRLAYTSPLLETDASFVHGIAGWGWASLHFYRRTGNAYFLERACAGGEALLRSAAREGDALCWTNSSDNKVHFGFGHGASGIARFLLQLSIDSGEDRFMRAARQALDYDVSHRVDLEYGPAWGRFPDDSLVEPYWLHGNAGVGTALLRFYEYERDPADLRLALSAAQGTRVRYTILPGQWTGMSGLGEFLLDVYRITGREEYRKSALDLAESVLWYRIERTEGWAFPGSSLQRISTDFATGSAGIGMFLHRLRATTPQIFMDLDAAAPAARSVISMGASESPVSV